ncbi:hypothetical protein PILCRDRAFT_816433 [Piloderma croceum F 1598]|uniref:Uncharacterized protein n=1 Tax=Piloderma croceum (strain F 1598) TaxID=765440 RepID=A0A0C3G732_PILCF|nr:hypothetical protein PILCRDRAFT_816433 [Piloderma croceum F 1598]
MYSDISGVYNRRKGSPTLNSRQLDDNILLHQSTPQCRVDLVFHTRISGSQCDR